MKNITVRFYLSVLLFIISTYAFSQSISMIPKENISIEKWVTAQFSQQKLPPFSFRYNGQHSSQFIRKWKYTAEKQLSEDQKVIKYSITYADPLGLEVKVYVNGYLQYNAVDWMIQFINTSDNNSKVISDVRVSDLSLIQNNHSTKLHYLKGSYSSIEDFMPQMKVFSSQDSLYVHPEGGRSSDKEFPFFNLEMGDKEGVVFSVGWTGTWYASLHCIDKDFNIATGIENLNAFLYPHESIRTSSVCFLFWNGSSYIDGHNKFRRFIRENRTRKINGNVISNYPSFNGFNWGDPEPCNEYTCMTEEYATFLIHRWRQFNLLSDAIWLDAGWYTHANEYEKGKHWANTVGNWKIDRKRFPNGFKTISNEAHKAGLNFMVWFEPERVYSDSDWAKEHPEWMLHLKNSKSNNYLFNLGDKNACKWLCKYIGDFIEENGIDYYRQDFNISPERYWLDNDEVGRNGICEIKYIEGLYAYWDYLLDRFPNLLIDNCASGGRRLDYETTLRSAPMWRTDYGYGAGVEGYQCQTYGLNLFLPFSGTGVYATDKYHFRSSIGSSAVFNWKITTNEMSF